MMGKTLKVISVIADIISIILYINFMTGWTINDILCNPYLKVLTYTLLFTALVFLVPVIFNKISNILLKTSLYVLLGATAIAIFLFFPNGKCGSSADVSNSGPTSQKQSSPIIHDTIRNTIYKPLQNNIEKKKIATSVPSRSQNSAETPNSASKNDLKGSTFNGPTQIGDNNTQNNTFGKPERHITPDFIDQIVKTNTHHLPVEVFYYAVTPEVTTFANEIIEALKKRGVTVTHTSVIPFAPTDYPKDKDMQYYNSDTLYQITIWPQLSK